MPCGREDELEYFKHGMNYVIFLKSNSFPMIEKTRKLHGSRPVEFSVARKVLALFVQVA